MAEINDKDRTPTAELPHGYRMAAIFKAYDMGRADGRR